MKKIIVERAGKDIPPTAAFKALRGLPRPFIVAGAPCADLRYSYTAANPFMVIEVPYGRRDAVLYRKNGKKEVVPLGDSTPFDLLSQIIKERAPEAGGGPFPYNGGAAGFFSYDLKDLLFRLPEPPEQKKAHSLKLPYCAVGLYDAVYVYDHCENQGYYVSTPVDSGSERRLERMRKLISGGAASIENDTGGWPTAGFTSNITKKDFLRAVQRAKEYISEGDIYQINLSQRLDAPWDGDPFTLYDGLLQSNPTPFSSYFDFGPFELVSNSPERLLKVEGPLIETSPIKGTRKRGADPEEDLLFIEELKKSHKERAEHVMIVDLERNDLGRVSLPGTVEVTEFERIETFTRLHHMVSTVRGARLPGIAPLKALEKIFPGGSITGAPKIRAMEIIEELERVPREIYTGGAGLIDFSGDMDIAVVIRTAVCAGGRIYLHVGGGIVADSVPEDEYDETILKAMDFFDLLNITVKGFC